MDEATRPLTAKQQQFCREYIIDLNAAAAARRAGYSEHTAEQQGSRLLSNAKVQAEIQQAMDERAEQAGVDAEYVVQHLKDEAENAKSDSARVQALGLLARHLGMLTDRVEVETVTRRLIVLNTPSKDANNPVEVIAAPENSPLLEGGVEG